MAAHRWQRTWFRFSPKRNIHGIASAVWVVAAKADREVVFHKLEEALHLIKEYSPVRFTQLCGDVDRILIAGDPTFWGRYVRELRLIEIYDGYAVAPETSPEQLASTLIHEAQHARLFRLGFGYAEQMRGRIERLCFMAERNFAHRIPNGSKIAESAEDWMSADSDTHFSNKARRRRKQDALRELGCPEWIVKLLERLGKRRAT